MSWHENISMVVFWGLALLAVLYVVAMFHVERDATDACRDMGYTHAMSYEGWWTPRDIVCSPERVPVGVPIGSPYGGDD